MNRFAKQRLFHPKSSAKGGKRADLGGLFVRSRWEANIARILNILKERGEIELWKYEPCEFQFPVKRGTRFYKPDFEVVYPAPVGKVYWEAKGLLDAKSVTALNRMAKYHPEVVVLIVGKKEYAAFESEFGDLEHWER